MRKGREIVGLPVVVLSTARRAGLVQDLVIDLDTRRVAALMVRGAEGDVALVPFESIHRVGPDAVTVADDSALTAVADRPDLRTLVESPVKVVGLQVLTEGGRLVGSVSDVVVDTLSGSIEQFETSVGVFRDLVGGRGYLSSRAVLSVGDGLLIAPEGALGGREVEEGPPLVLEAPPWFRSQVVAREIEETAAALVARQEELVIGLRAGRSISNDDGGGFIVLRGEPITQETIRKAEAAGKVNDLIQAAGEAARGALSLGVAERYSEVGRMAARSVHAPDGDVIVAQGDAITPQVVERARHAGVVDQLMDAIRSGQGESTSQREAARILWEGIVGSIGRLTGRS